MSQEQVESGALATSIQTVWHVHLQALLRVVRATATHAVVVRELRVAAIQTPAVSSPRNSLRHACATEAFTAEELLLRALLCVV